jgi:hypothetical protein
MTRYTHAHNIQTHKHTHTHIHTHIHTQTHTPTHTHTHAHTHIHVDIHTSLPTNIFVSDGRAFLRILAASSTSLVLQYVRRIIQRIKY